ncbi:Rv2231c family pyridoxal phosphate-dependent protein CobC [Acrocarpospora pleiomorpha]|uniref:Rv2231c family pyridoxal phosphate-dependent protein CobC n=1 Tax=Acrocarpospora pleiomorpha TaxID=90975 RepID=UPI0031E3A7DB
MVVSEWVDLRHHGDREVAPGLVDLAVNVRQGMPPGWLADVVRDAVGDLAAYPSGDRARAAVAERHGRGVDEVLLTAGAAEAFVLLARVLRPRRAVVVHPQFTEPEAALAAAGHRVERVILSGAFTLDPELVPDDADLVMVGNPTNPTSVSHPVRILRSLIRPGRTLVVDEAFADCIPGEPESLASVQLPGLIVIRSLTKTWGLAGLRIGYVLADAPTIAQLAEAQPLWAVSTPALAAAEACMTPRAIAEAETWARQLATDRNYLVSGLRSLGAHVIPNPQASFVCVRLPAVRLPLREKGFAVRRGDTFPGLGEDWIRIAVRDPDTSDALLKALEVTMNTSPTR